MSEYKDVINALSTKLQQDRNTVKFEDGSENLNYIMDARLHQDIVDVFMDKKLVSYSDAVDAASIIATKYLDWLIDLPKRG